MCPGWQNHGVVAPRDSVPVTMSRHCSAFSFAENQETKGLLLSNCAAAHVKAEDKLLHVGVHHMDRCRWAHLHLEAHVQRLARTESRREGDELFKPAGLQLPNLQSGDNTDSPYGIATRMK